MPGGSGDELSGMGGKIAVFTNQVWEIYSPNEGWLGFVQDQESLWVYSSGDWREVTQGAFTDTFERLGINASADDFNGLTVNAEANLLNHDGAGHQLKINKESETDTASCVFQSGFSGRAELGLVQSDNLVLRTSVDGAALNTALEIDNATLSVGLGGQDPSTNFGLAVDQRIKISSGDRLHNLFQSEGSFQITSMENFSSAQAWHGSFLMAKRSCGTVSQPETVQNGDLVFLLDIYSHDGQDFHRTAQQRFFVEGEPQEAAIPMGYDFRLTDQEGILHSRTRILPNGDVGIGEYAPSTKLHVDGPVRENHTLRRNCPAHPIMAQAA